MNDDQPQVKTSDPTLDKLRRITMGITGGRLLAALLISWLILSGYLGGAFWLFILAGLGALLEGSAALMFKTRTRLGALLDGLADRLLAVLPLLALAYVGLLWLWVLVPLLLREVVLALGQKLPEAAGNEPWIREPRWLFHVNIVAAELLSFLFLLVQGAQFGVDLLILPMELIVVTLALAGMATAYLNRPKPEDEYLSDDKDPQA